MQRLLCCALGVLLAVSVHTPIADTVLFEPVPSHELIPKDINGVPIGSAFSDCNLGHFEATQTAHLKVSCSSAKSSTWRIVTRFSDSRTNHHFFVGTGAVVAKRDAPMFGAVELYLLTTDQVVRALDSATGAQQTGISLSHSGVVHFPDTIQDSANRCALFTDPDDRHLVTFVQGLGLVIIRCIVPEEDTANFHFAKHSTVLLPTSPKSFQPALGVGYATVLPLLGNSNSQQNGDGFAWDPRPSVTLGFLDVLDRFRAFHTGITLPGMTGMLLSPEPYRYSCIHFGALLDRPLTLGSRNACIHSLNPGHVCLYFKYIYPMLLWKQQSSLVRFIADARAIIDERCPLLKVSLSPWQYLYSVWSSVWYKDDL